jgi:hypothetical protein
LESVIGDFRRSLKDESSRLKHFFQIMLMIVRDIKLYIPLHFLFTVCFLFLWHRTIKCIVLFYKCIVSLVWINLTN